MNKYNFQSTYTLIFLHFIQTNVRGGGGGVRYVFVSDIPPSPFWFVFFETDENKFYIPSVQAYAHALEGTGLL